MLHSSHPPDPAGLLDAFVRSGDDEAAFEALVAHFGGLVFSSALRRAGDPQLAEEITQNVFAVLARKAKSLRKHPSLTAWIFETTRLESAAALRVERRRQRKHAALASEMKNSNDTPHDSLPEDDAAWRDAVPILDRVLDGLPAKDRNIILQRFYENRKFSEIATRTGSSEAACKMRLKRALSRIAKIFTSRGVTLSATALTAGLTAEFAKSAPVQALAAITPKALAASTTLSATTLATNAIQTMSTFKTVTITGTAVLAVASAPFVLQESEAKRLKSELSRLESDITGLRTESAALLDEWKTAEKKRAASNSTTAPRTIHSLLAAANEPVDAETLMKNIMEVMTGQDMVGMIRLFLPIVNMSADEYNRLVEEVQATNSNPQMKQMAMQMLGTFAPTGSPKEAIERLMELELEAHTYSGQMQQWAADDPDAAWKWYQEKLAAGELQGKGIHNTPDKVLMGSLIGGMAKSDPARALELYDQALKDGGGNISSWQLANTIGKEMKESGDDQHFRKLLEIEKANGRGYSAVEAALHNYTSAGKDLEAGKEFIETYIDDAGDRASVATSMLTNMQGMKVSERADWFVENFPPDDDAQHLQAFVQRMSWQNPDGISEWVSGQPSGAVRDNGMSAIVDYNTGVSRFSEALEQAGQIGDAALKKQALERLGQRWLALDPDKARAALPAELVTQLER